MKSWNRNVLSLTVALTLGCGFANMALSQPEATPTAEKLSDVVRKSKIIKPDSPLQIVIEGKEARVTTLRSSNATDQDCKIDAVLIAKDVFEAFPKKITRVKTQFGSTEKNTLHQVAVTEGDVKAYGTGAISENELLSSLELVNIISDAKTESNRIGVKAGPFESDRSLLSMNIDRLQSKGTNVRVFQKLFEQLENSLATEDKSSIQRRIEDLRQKLREQDQLVRQADTISDGYANRTATLRQRFARFGHMGELPAPAQSTASNGSGHASNESPGSSPSKTTVAAGPFAAATIWFKTRQKLNQMRDAGQNVSGYDQQLSEAERLLRQGKKVEARNVVDDLAHSLGIQ